MSRVTIFTGNGCGDGVEVQFFGAHFCASLIG